MSISVGKLIAAPVLWVFVALLLATTSCNGEREPTPRRDADSAYFVPGYDTNYIELRSLLKKFAQDNKLQFVDETISHPKKGDLVNIEVFDPRVISIWVTTGILDPRLKVLIFSDQANSDNWREYEVDLKKRLIKRFGEIENVSR